MSERLYGTDPEFFIYEETINDKNFGKLCKVIPPASLIADYGATFTVSKNNKRILINTDDYNVIEDGAALEINFKKPFENSSELSKTFNHCKQTITTYLRKFGAYLNLSTDVLGHFDCKKYWEGRDENFLDAVRFGCDPDEFPKLYLLNGFEQETCKIIDASEHQYRYAGGHLHVQNMSNNPDVYLDNLELAPIVFDFIVGTTNVLLKRSQKIKTQELERLKYFGRPGRVRLQKYSDKVNGLEYRPLSNQWLTDGYNLKIVFDSANIAANIIENNLCEDFYQDFKDNIFTMWDALTTHDKDLCSNLLTDVLSWTIENNISTMEEVATIYGNF